MERSRNQDINKKKFDKSNGILRWSIETEIAWVIISFYEEEYWKDSKKNIYLYLIVLLGRRIYI